MKNTVMRICGNNRIIETIAQNIQLMNNINKQSSSLMKAQREPKGKTE
jgi:hypothetical protein